MSILAIQSLRKTFGGLVATNDVSLSIEEGECHALIGPNGAGKTTLISLLMGDMKPNSGSISLRGKPIDGLPAHARVHAGIARSYQVTNLIRKRSVLDNMRLALIGRDGSAFTFFKPLSRETAMTDEAHDWLDRFGLSNRAEDHVADLSHGEQRALELALALAAKPAVVLLDEPMAGLGREETIAMTAMLKKLRGSVTILLVEHDMHAVFELADRVTVLVSGTVLITGAPDEVRSDRRVHEVYLGEEG
ncbi:ABC transporter ATP-binding protein [Halodurantibacterium flavum]|uniref:ABC transporter ATP-binding protein n=1 Tax=Halodurantibacterium flavum TaxID=1382802 RepID=A0ABW4S2L7_9RHOB